MAIPVIIYELGYQGNIISYRDEVESPDDIKNLEPIYGKEIKKVVELTNKKSNEQESRIPRKKSFK